MADFAVLMGLLGKRCRDCWNIWPLAAFDRKGPCVKCTSHMERNCPCKDCEHPGCYRPICAMCRLTSATERDLWAKKVYNSLLEHASDDGITLDQLLVRLGTTLEAEAEAWEQEYEAGFRDSLHREIGRCRNCRKPWATMKHGPADMTLDRRDSDKPLTRSNMRFFCITCNRAKSKMSAEKFDLRQRCWELWEAAPRRVRPEQLELVSGISRVRRAFRPRSRQSKPPPRPPQLGFF